MHTQKYVNKHYAADTGWAEAGLHSPRNQPLFLPGPLFFSLLATRVRCTDAAVALRRKGLADERPHPGVRHWPALPPCDMCRRCAEWLGLPTAAVLAGLGLGDRVNLPAIFRRLGPACRSFEKWLVPRLVLWLD